MKIKYVPSLNILIYSILFFVSFNLAANVIWPGLVVVSYRLSHWLLIVLGLILEWLIITAGSPLNYKQAGIVTLCMNIGSVLIGILLIPISDIMLLPMSYIAEIVRVITPELLSPISNNLGLSIIEYGMLLITYSTVNVAIEYPIFKVISKKLQYPAVRSLKLLLLIFLANLVSMGIVIYVAFSNLHA